MCSLSLSALRRGMPDHIVIAIAAAATEEWSVTRHTTQSLTAPRDVVDDDDQLPYSVSAAMNGQEELQRRLE